MFFEYDATQEKCPLPLVKTRLLLKKMKKGDSCLVRIADQGSKQDIPKLLTKKGYVFKETVLEGFVVELLIQYRDVNG